MWQQVLEITLVLENRFHYTMDVVMAIIITLLIYSTGPVAIAAKSWQNWRGPFWAHPDDEVENSSECIDKASCHISPSEQYSDAALAWRLKRLFKKVNAPGNNGPKSVNRWPMSFQSQPKVDQRVAQR